LAWFYKERPTLEELLGEIQLIDQLPEHGADHLAHVYGAFEGDDREIYLVEELLFKSLQALRPLRNAERFFRFAADLSDGLASLHELHPPKVHRDLKLENCGVDYFGRAKIFDLGSVTSEGGIADQTILSKAPELFEEGALCNRQTDVWALGAVLFALWTQDYPFVQAHEALNRPRDKGGRFLFDKDVKAQAQSAAAEAKLRDRIRTSFPDGSRAILEAMLSFDPERRPSVREAANRWSEALSGWAQPTEVGSSATTGAQIQNAKAEVSAYLRAYIGCEVGMSTVQWERVCKTIQDLENQLETSQFKGLRELQSQVGALREKDQDSANILRRSAQSSAA